MSKNITLSTYATGFEQSIVNKNIIILDHKMFQFSDEFELYRSATIQSKHQIPLIRNEMLQ